MLSTVHRLVEGNELSGSGVGTRVGAGQYAADVVSLKQLVDEVYGASPSLEKPLVIAPGGFFEPEWFEEIVVRTRPNLMDVITHHIYNLGPGMPSDHRRFGYSWQPNSPPTRLFFSWFPLPMICRCR